MENRVGRPRYSPDGWRWLRKAIEAAGLPKKERLPPYEEYLAAFDRENRELEDQGVMIQLVPIDVPRMLEWIDEQGLEATAAAREQYLRARYGDSPMRRLRKTRRRCERDGVDPRELRKAGMLTCWRSGDSRWCGTATRPSRRRWRRSGRLKGRPRLRNGRI